MRSIDVTAPMLRVLSSALGVSALPNSKLTTTAWSLFEHGWCVQGDPRSWIRVYTHSPDCTPFLRKGVFVVHQSPQKDWTEVTGLSKRHHVQSKIVWAPSHELLTRPEQYKSQLPDLSAYDVPWEIAWIRSRKARWEAIRSYRRATSEY